MRTNQKRQKLPSTRMFKLDILGAQEDFISMLKVRFNRALLICLQLLLDLGILNILPSSLGSSTECVWRNSAAVIRCSALTNGFLA